jgi:hypothetical protein
MVTRTDGPFEYWEVTGDAVRAAAETPGSNAAVIQSLAGELEGDEKSAADAIEGDIEAGVKANTTAAKNAAQNLAAKGQYAVGLLNQFGVDIDTFDGTVNQINIDYLDQYQSRIFGLHHMPEYHSGEETIDYAGVAASIKADLMPRYQEAEATIDDDADHIASKFKQGPTDENVRELIQAGLIPLTSAGLWPDLKLSNDDVRQALQSAIENGTMPDFSTMSIDEIKTYLGDNPEVSDSILALMAAPQLSPALRNLVNAQAAVDADLLNSTLDEDPDQDTVAEVNAATARLAAINESIADGQPMTAAQGDYIETWLNTVGADNLTKVADHVRSSIPAGAPSYAIDSMVQARLAPIADAVLNYSNPAVHRDDAGIDQAGYYGGSTFIPADGKITLSEMPQAIQDLTAMRLGYENEPGNRLGVEPDVYTSNGPRGGTTTHESIGDEQFSDIANYDRYSGFADLMSSASDGVEGGADFSEALGDQAIQARQDLNAIAETASDTVTGYEQSTTGRGRGAADYAELDISAFNDGPMSDMLGVTARSEDGSSQLLLDKDNRQSLLAIDWNDSEGATSVITAGTDRAAEGGGDTELQARAAAAILTDVSEAPEQWAERMNEPMEDAALDTGLRWVDTFGVAGDTENGVDADGQDILGRDVGPTIALTDDAKENFMLFAAGTGDEQAVRFQAGMTHYGNQLIHDALHPDPDANLSANAQSDQLKSAMTWAGRAEGRMEAANIQSAMNEIGGEHAENVAQAIAANRETASNKAAATFVTSLASSGLGAIPGAGPFISAGLGATSGPIIHAIFEQTPVPDYESADDNERADMIATAKQDAEFSRDYRFAGLVSPQYAGSPDYAGLYEPDGTLRPFDELSGTDKNKLGNLGDNLYEDFSEAHPDQSSISRSETYDEAFSNTLESATVNLHEPDPDESEEEREEREQAESDAEAERMRLLLYGDNQREWDRWNQSMPLPQHPRGGTPEPRESPYDTTVGANG